MNKKEHQIWQDFKYDEYLMNKWETIKVSR